YGKVIQIGAPPQSRFLKNDDSTKIYHLKRPVSLGGLSRNRFLNFVEGALQNIVFSRDAKAHMVVEQIRVGKGAARYAGHSRAADQHFIELHGVPKPFRDARP